MAARAVLEIADRCVIATDSDEVADAVRPHGAEALLTSATHPSGTDRVAEVAARPEFRDFDAIVNVQGDEPFVTRVGAARCSEPSHLRQFSTGYRGGARAGARFSMSPASSRSSLPMTAGQCIFRGRPFRSCVTRRRHPCAAHGVWQHIGVYAYARDALAQWVSLPPHPLEQIERLEQLRPLAAGLAMGVALVDEIPAVGVDTVDDLRRANADWKDLNGRI